MGLQCGKKRLLIFPSRLNLMSLKNGGKMFGKGGQLLYIVDEIECCQSQVKR